MPPQSAGGAHRPPFSFLANSLGANGFSRARRFQRGEVNDGGLTPFRQATLRLRFAFGAPQAAVDAAIAGSIVGWTQKLVEEGKAGTRRHAPLS